MDPQWFLLNFPHQRVGESGLKGAEILGKERCWLGQWLRGQRGGRLLRDLAGLYLESNTLRMPMFDLTHYYDNYVRIKVTF